MLPRVNVLHSSQAFDKPKRPHLPRNSSLDFFTSRNSFSPKKARPSRTSFSARAFSVSMGRPPARSSGQGPRSASFYSHSSFRVCLAAFFSLHSSFRACSAASFSSRSSFRKCLASCSHEGIFSLALYVQAAAGPSRLRCYTIEMKSRSMQNPLQ